MAVNKHFKPTTLAVATMSALNDQSIASGIRKPLSLRHSAARTLAAASISAAVMMPTQAFAQESTNTTTTLSTIQVEEQAIDPNPNAEIGVPYKAKTSADSRHTRPIAEIPQTIQVITKSSIDDSGKTDLADILLSSPGVTLGAGENGNMFGDNYYIRGQAIKSDIFVDGLRDPGMSTRESFAVEQIEITKGPNSSFAGRGSAGGAVNAVTKQATLDYDFTRVNAGVGTDGFVRNTVDVNQAFGDNFALRINALWADQNVPERAPAGRERKGIALSGLYEASKDFSVTLDYYGSRASNPYYDGGAWLVGPVGSRAPAIIAPPHTQDGEHMKSNIDAVTARIKWNISPTVSLDSRTRYGSTTNSFAFTTATYNVNANNGTGLNPGAIVLNDQHSRWQEVKYFAHQDNLRWNNTLFGLKNETVFTVEFTDHKVDQGPYVRSDRNPFNCKTSAGAGALNGFCMSTFGPQASITPLANIQGITGRQWARSGKNYDWNIKTVAVSAMDTIDFTDRFTGFVGVRFDRIVDFNAKTFNANTGVNTGDYKYKTTLKNYWGGLSYKVNDEGMFYFGFGTGQDINCGEPDSGTNPSYGGCVTQTLDGQMSSKPETSRNIELGTKWNLLDQKLLATASIFRTEKGNVMEGVSQAEGNQLGTLNTGANRVQGLELGLVGNITDELTIQAGAALMKSEITKSHPSIAGGGPNAIGKPISNFADRTYNVQAKYQFTPAFAFGGIVRHESRRCGGQPDTAARFVVGVTDCSQPVPGFTVGDLFATYRVNKNFLVRGTVTNITNKDYYLSVYQNGNFLAIGDKRRATVTLEMDF